jgi:hypothetical protein
MTIPPKTVFFISILLTRTPDTVGNLDRDGGFSAARRTARMVTEVHLQCVRFIENFKLNAR